MRDYENSDPLPRWIDDRCLELTLAGPGKPPRLEGSFEGQANGLIEFEALAEQQAGAQINVDLLGVVWTARAVLPQMFEQGGGDARDFQFGHIQAFFGHIRKHFRALLEASVQGIASIIPGVHIRRDGYLVRVAMRNSIKPQAVEHAN